MFYRLELGVVAVTVFFALSGFVVSEAATLFYAGRPAHFLVNRAFRILPLFGVALTLTVALDCWFYAHGHLVPLDAALKGAPWTARVVLAGLLEIVPGLPAHRISGQHLSFIPFAWTLRVEGAFYMVAGLACWRPIRRQYVAIVSCITYVLFGLFLWRHTLLPQQMLCIPFFAFGVCVHQTAKNITPAAALNLLALLACAEIAFTYWGQRGDPHLAFQLPLLGLLFATLVWLSRQTAPHQESWDKRLGALSYPLYIGHGVILTLLMNITAQRNWLLYATGMAASVALALALNAAVEHPMRKLRARVRGVAI